MKTKICAFIDEQQKVEDFCRQLGLSKTQLKFFLSKNLREKLLSPQQELDLPLDLVNYGHINSHYQGPKVEIIFEDKNFLVINKPAGIHGHPLAYSETNTILNFLRSEGRVLDVNRTSFERGLLYRLDRETSGVLVYIKNHEQLEKLREHFASEVKKKKYLALVSGKFSHSGEKVIHLQSFGPAGAKMVAKEDGRRAVSIFALEEYRDTNDQSLVSVEIKTGVRHQIRAHLAHLGFPILGDSLYGGEKSYRLMLHALSYQIEWKGKVFSFTAPREF